MKGTELIIQTEYILPRYYISTKQKIGNNESSLIEDNENPNRIDEEMIVSKKGEKMHYFSKHKCILYTKLYL